MKKPVFSWSSSNLWVNLVTFVLAGFALAGVELPENPNSLSTEIVTLVKGGGYIAVIGIIILNVANPLYHAVIKSAFNLKAMLGSPNFWVNLGSLAASAVAAFGLAFPDGTIEQIVGAIYAKDYSALIFLLIANIGNPLIRWFREKKKADEGEDTPVAAL